AIPMTTAAMKIIAAVAPRFPRLIIRVQLFRPVSPTQAIAVSWPRIELLLPQSCEHRPRRMSWVGSDRNYLVETALRKTVINVGLVSLMRRRWVWVRFYFRSHSRLRCSRLPPLRPRHLYTRRSYARLSARAPLIGVVASLSAMPR